MRRAQARWSPPTNLLRIPRHRSTPVRNNPVLPAPSLCFAGRSTPVPRGAFPRWNPDNRFRQLYFRLKMRVEIVLPLLPIPARRAAETLQTRYRRAWNWHWVKELADYLTLNSTLSSVVAPSTRHKFIKH